MKDNLGRMKEGREGGKERTNGRKKEDIKDGMKEGRMKGRKGKGAERVPKREQKG